MADKTRRVIKTKGFESDAKRLRKEIPRIDQFINGAEETLSRDPLVGKQTSNHMIRGLAMAAIPNSPRLVLYYGINKDAEVVFIMLAKEGDPRGGAMIM